MEENQQNLQRFLQIREEVHEEIAKIPPIVLQLQEATNRFVGHFRVFESLSQNIQDQIKSTLKNAAFEMAELASEEFMKRIEDQAQNILTNLDQTANEVRSALENVSKKNIWKMMAIITLLVLFSLSIGFGLGGYYYEKRSYILSKEFLKDLSIKENPQKKKQR